MGIAFSVGVFSVPQPAHAARVSLELGGATFQLRLHLDRSVRLDTIDHVSQPHE